MIPMSQTCKETKKNGCFRTCIKVTVGQSFEPGNPLIWYKMTGKSDLQSPTVQWKKKTTRSDSFTLSKNVVHSISFRAKELNAIVITVRF